MATQQIKDILNQETPTPAFTLIPSHAAPLPSKIESFTRPNPQGRAFDPRSYSFTNYGADEPRIEGDRAGLLLENFEQTNEVHHSTQFSNWNTFLGASTTTSLNIKNIVRVGASATRINPDSSVSPNSGIGQKSAGSFTATQEVFGAILEKRGADRSGIRVRDFTTNDTVTSISYDWVNDNLTLKNGTSIWHKSRVLREHGPNNGKTVLIVAGYNPNNTNSAGNQRRFQIFADQDSSGGDVIAHYAGLYENARFGSPIVTGAGPVTRGGDNLTIWENSPPSWFNDREGTWVMEAEPRQLNYTNGYYLDNFGQGHVFRIFNGQVEAKDASGTRVEAGSPTAGSTFKAACGFDFQGFDLAVDGSVASAGSHDGTFLQNGYRMGAVGELKARIYRLVYYPTRISATQLKGLTV